MYDYDYVYDYNNSVANTSGILAMLGAYSFIIMAASIFMLVCMWKIFKKAGKNGWEAIIPIYNIIILLEITDLPTWYIVLLFIPFANIYAIFKIYIELAHKFGKSTGFGVAMVFFGIVCMPMLAFGNSTYEGKNNNSSYANQMNMYQANSYYSNQNNNMGQTRIVNNQMMGQSVNTPIQNQNVNNPQGINNQLQQSTILNQNSIQQGNNQQVAPVNNIPNQNINNVQQSQVVNSQVTEPTVSAINQNNMQQVQETNQPVSQTNTPVQAQTSKFCPQCGNKVDVSSNACFMCGHKF